MTDNNIVHFPGAGKVLRDNLTGHVTPAFEVLDSARTYANTAENRFVMDMFGHVEPFAPDLDTWRSMPLRLAHDAASDWHIELGPFDLDAADVERLRDAIAAYDKAVGR